MIEHRIRRLPAVGLRGGLDRAVGTGSENFFGGGADDFANSAKSAAVAASKPDGNGKFAPSAEKANGLLAGARILVADDLTDARELVALTFRNEGALVEAYASGGEALAARGEDTDPVNKNFDLFVCDIGMPDEDGYSIIARLGEFERLRGGQLPAVALTAFSGLEDKNRALAAGFRRHISKPVDPHDLVLAAVSLLSKN